MKKLNVWKKTAAFLLSLAVSAGALSMTMGTCFAENADIASSAAVDEKAEPEEIIDTEYETYEESYSAEDEYNELILMSNADFREEITLTAKYYADEYYRRMTGKTAADIIVDLPYDSRVFDIALYDEEGEVVEVYSVDTNGYEGTDQNGNYVDLKKFDTGYYYNEDELFAPLHNISDAVNLYLKEKYSLGPEDIPYSYCASGTNRLFKDSDLTDFYSIDKNGNTVIVVSIDMKTGLGTDSKGNEVDLNNYVPPESKAICDIVRADYKARNGEQHVTTLYDIWEDSEDSSSGVIVYIFNIYDKIIEYYKIDPETGIAETYLSGDIDLNKYFEAVISEDENDEDDEYKKFLLSSEDYRIVRARDVKKYSGRLYTQKTGNTAADITVEIPYDNEYATVTLTDENGDILDVYTVSVFDFFGKDMNGEDIQLDPEKELLYDEDIAFDTYFSSQNTAFYYFYYFKGVEKGIIPYSVFFDLRSGKTIDGNTAIDYYILDSNAETIEVYTVDVTTGVGTDREGNYVDLGAFVDSIDKELCEFVRKDYYSRNGESIVRTEIIPDEAGGSAKIVVRDYLGEMLAVYTVDLTTYIAETQDGETVDFGSQMSEIQEDEFFMPAAEIEKLIINYFAENEEIVPAGFISTVENKTYKIKCILFDSGLKFHAYTFDIRTGIGTDTNGNIIDLAAYAEELSAVDTNDETGFFAPSDKLCEMAVKDVEMKTEETVGNTVYAYNPKTNTALICLMNEKGGAIDTYSIDPVTGKGVTAFGEDVDLPQTGMSGMHKAIAGLAALMAVIGAVVIKKNYREDED